MKINDSGSIKKPATATTASTSGAARGADTTSASGVSSDSVKLSSQGQALAARKAALVEEMNALAASRAMALAAGGQDATAAGMAAWLAARGQPERDAWRELLALAEEGRELNRVNGLLIHGHIGRNGAALQALRGGGQPAVYGRNGQQAVASSGRAIVAG